MKYDNSKPENATVKTRHIDPNISFTHHGTIGQTWIVGGKSKIKMADHVMQCTIFNIEYDDNIDFSINHKYSLQELFEKLAIFLKKIYLQHRNE